jgi:diguanylate cyclase (GGDEF)-like protein
MNERKGRALASSITPAGGDDDILLNLLSLYEKTAALVALYDSEDRLRDANQAFRAAFHIGGEEAPLWADLMRRNFQAGVGSVIRARDFEAWLISTQSRRGKVGFRAFETDLCDGRWLWMTETIQSNGWMLCIATDVTELKAGERSVRQDRDLAIRASQTDELTGVSNRRYAWARIDDLLKNVAMSQSTGCIAILDIDHFKSINDRYGHQAGDLVLQRFARMIHDQVRRTDCFGRMGGEEFILILPDTQVAEAAAIVQRMLERVRASELLAHSPDMRCTFSAGVAVAHPGDTPSDLYARADRALYAAKMAGRNCVHLDETPPPLQIAAQ